MLATLYAIVVVLAVCVGALVGIIIHLAKEERPVHEVIWTHQDGYPVQLTLYKYILSRGTKAMLIRACDEVEAKQVAAEKGFKNPTRIERFAYHAPVVREGVVSK